MTFEAEEAQILDSVRRAEASAWEGEVGTVLALNANTEALLLLAREQRAANLLLAWDADLPVPAQRSALRLALRSHLDLDLGVERSTVGGVRDGD